MITWFQFLQSMDFQNPGNPFRIHPIARNHLAALEHGRTLLHLIQMLFIELTIDLKRNYIIGINYILRDFEMISTRPIYSVVQSSV